MAAGVEHTGGPPPLSPKLRNYFVHRKGVRTCTYCLFALATSAGHLPESGLLPPTLPTSRYLISQLPVLVRVRSLRLLCTSELHLFSKGWVECRPGFRRDSLRRESLPALISYLQ